jgi:hypothetical protein
MSSERRHIFYDYLSYGGVHVSPNMFQSAAGLDQKTMSKQELATALSQVAIGSDKYDIGSPNAIYAVDFVGCAKSFLSRHAELLYGFETFENVLLVTTTLERFMDYLLQHDVCPEYKSDVLETRDFCRAAASEIWDRSQAQKWLPGDFNVACSTMFDGEYAKNYNGSTDWETEPDGPKFVGMTHNIATQVIKMGIAGAAPEHIYQKYMSIANSKDTAQRFEIVERIPGAGFTVTKIFQPTKECLKLYKSESADFRPLGRIVAVPWTNPDKPPEDLTEEERNIPGFTLAEQPVSKLVELKEQEYSFLIESPLVTHLRVGMHIEATIHRLNFGIDFFDEVTTFFPSFDNYLCNDLMVGWKDPRWLTGNPEYRRDEERRAQEEAERADQQWKAPEEVEETDTTQQAPVPEEMRNYYLAGEADDDEPEPR